MKNSSKLFRKIRTDGKKNVILIHHVLVKTFIFLAAMNLGIDSGADKVLMTPKDGYNFDLQLEQLWRMGTGDQEKIKPRPPAERNPP